MARASTIQTNFTAGELSPLLAGRIDLRAYPNGLQICENFLPLAQGPADRRGGTRFIAAAKSHSQPARLVNFEFSDVQAYMIEAGAGYFRFFKDKGIIETSPGSAYEIANPYGPDDLAGLSWAQSADFLYIVHRNHAPRRLTRSGHTSWVLATIDFIDGPYLRENTSTTTLTPSATGGSITLTASAATGINSGSGFLTSDVGRLVRLGQQAPEWQTSHAYTVGDVVRNSSAVYRCVTAGTSAASTGPTTSGAGIVDGTVTWERVSVGGVYWGWGRITARASTTSITVQIETKLANTTATAAWRLGLWSDTTGWPETVTFHQERLVFGSNTTAAPQRIDASKTGDFETFSPGIEDGDALAFALNTGTVNRIRWLVSNRVLLAGTQGAEFVIAADSLSSPLTPVNAQATPHSYHGCADIAACNAGGSVLFVQRAGRKLREMKYDFQTDSYTAPDLTLLGEHVTLGGIREMAWAAEPFGVLWACRTDGLLIGCTYLPEQEVTGWHRHPLGGGGLVESLTVIPAGDGSDQLWLLVRRTIGGETVRYIEILEPPLPLTGSQADGFYVDCGLSYSGDAADLLTGLDHLEGQTVQILADGGVHPQRVVTDGSVALDFEASTVHVGLGFVSRLSPMPIEAGANEGTAQGRTKRIHRLIVRLARSLGGAAGRDAENLAPIAQDRDPSVPMDSPMPLFTGDAEIRFPGNYDRAGDVLLIQDQPLPFTVSAFLPQLNTAD